MRSLPRTFALLALSVSSLAAVACGHRAAADPVAQLKSPDPGERRDAADQLRGEGGPTPEEARAVLEAIKTETDEKTYAAMMITLGASGLPDAEPIICGKIYAPDARNRGWANKALKLYLQHNRNAKGCPPPGAAPAGATPAPGAAPAQGAAPASGEGVTIGPK